MPTFGLGDYLLLAAFVAAAVAMAWGVGRAIRRALSNLHVTIEILEPKDEDD